MNKVCIITLMCFIATSACFAGPPPPRHGGYHHYHHYHHHYYDRGCRGYYYNNGLGLAAGIVNLVAVGLNNIFPTRSTVIVNTPPPPQPPTQYIFPQPTVVVSPQPQPSRVIYVNPQPPVQYVYPNQVQYVYPTIVTPVR